MNIFQRGRESGARLAHALSPISPSPSHTIDATTIRITTRFMLLNKKNTKNSQGWKLEGWQRVGAPVRVILVSRTRIGGLVSHCKRGAGGGGYVFWSLRCPGGKGMVRCIDSGCRRDAVLEGGTYPEPTQSDGRQPRGLANRVLRCQEEQAPSSVGKRG